MTNLHSELLSIINQFNTDTEFSLLDFGKFPQKSNKKIKKSVNFFSKKTGKCSDDSDSDGMVEPIFYYPNNYMVYYNIRQQIGNKRILSHRKWRKMNM